MTILTIFFLITAILYSSVGFGGGSTYLALMLIWGIPFYIFPIIALFCNIIVVSGNSINYFFASETNDKPNQGYENSLVSAGVGTSFEQYRNLDVSLGLTASHDDLRTDGSASASLQKQKGTYNEFS
mgnify:CR=1 FL=1